MKNIKLIAGVATTLSAVMWLATVKAEADSISTPGQVLAASDCSMIEQYPDGTQLVRTKRGLILKFFPNGLVIKKQGKPVEASVNAGCLSSLVNLSKH